jgi:hypothetical protein
LTCFSFFFVGRGSEPPKTRLCFLCSPLWRRIVVPVAIPSPTDVSIDRHLWLSHPKENFPWAKKRAVVCDPVVGYVFVSMAGPFDRNQ